ncbi:MAG: aminoacyl-tRNA hydrolase [Alphaproteobacteria bacterium]
MLLIVGLGNPGPDHAHNRHNVGFMAVDEVVRRHAFGAPRRRFDGEVCEGVLCDEKLLVLKPLTFMNRSGDSVGAALRFYKLAPERTIVFHDELDLAPGKLRVKRGGGAAGHNGLRSIAAHIGPEFRRVRIGIGHPGDKDLVTPYVLHDFAKADDAWLAPLLDAIADALPLLIAGDDSAFTTRIAYLTRPPEKKSASRTKKIGDEETPRAGRDEGE